MEEDGQYEQRGLYESRFEHDACGVGFVADITGQAAHSIITQGIQILGKLLHRGAAGGDAGTGDGAGVMFRIPDAFFRRVCGESGVDLPASGLYGVGMIFMPPDARSCTWCRRVLETVCGEMKLRFLGWREVPCDASVLGEKARAECPGVMQCFVGAAETDPAAFERRLYLLRKRVEHRVSQTSDQDSMFYIVSLSARTIVYKGLMMGPQIMDFYLDLHAEDMQSPFIVVHQRYSTNTFPSWRLAQPFRYLGHNGEINTLQGNRNQMYAREKELACDFFGAEIKDLFPIIEPGGSDSASLDNALELLVACGRDLPHAMMMLVPQAWGLKYPIGPDLRGFFEYHAGLMEPWDGPAALVFSDGERVGAMLDRNGLRPARYSITRDGLMVLASETGVLDLPGESVVEKGALGPGEMILADLSLKRVIKDAELKTTYARKKPYRRWVEENKIVLHGFFNDIEPVAADTAHLIKRQKLFGYTREDLDMILETMAATGHEPVGSMGCDTPLAVLSEQPQLLYSYFQQMFAQVTNPPIDSIREELVMSLMTFIGNPGNILADDPRNCRLIKLRHPVLSNEDLDLIRRLKLKDFRTVTIPMGFPAGGGGPELEAALQQMCGRAGEALSDDARSLFILSDRSLPDGIAPIPALLAVAAVNRFLVRQGRRPSSGLIVETGEAREVHHIAMLLGYGATAVNPYLAFESVADLAARRIVSRKERGTRALENYITALSKGLMKIMTKMGISTLRSYRSAQVYEAIGLDAAVVDAYFTGTPSRVGGIGLDGMAAEANARYRAAQDPAPELQRLLPSGGLYRYRKDGERHLWNPDTISLLQQATRRNAPDLYREYARRINDQAEQQSTLRGLLRFKAAAPVPPDEVEPVESIMKRFVTSAMSFGSISREVHETLAIAMNRIGAMSNCGEGGEDPARYIPLPNGDSRCSAVKQVASGRFGVTIEYLVNARELQIKIAQGAKPGEGGQLPGYKVNAEIARVRHSTPGVTLISPPPHHDIYSIEDIAQLIFDLRNANPQARVSVKLVSEAGVGTVAAGVAKGLADVILISGYDGGTGASPLSSIRHAGAPWELGLAETQQTLVLNNLRGRVRLQVDGQLKTGRDVVIGALLGAEEFGFASAPLVVCGCVMLRKCHENMCPLGVATQDPELRKHFTGKPEYVVNFFRMIAGEVREHMAALGFRRLDDMIGRADLLEMNDAIRFWKAQGLDLSRILKVTPPRADRPVRFAGTGPNPLPEVLDHHLIRLAADSLEKRTRTEAALPIRNVDRATGTMLSGEIAKRYQGAGLPKDTIVLRFQGSAGQSFGAFAAPGVTMILEGDANDYLGKGLSGGKIVVKPAPGGGFDPAGNVIAGNVLLYGATSGEVYVNGRVGERFAIRNSGAIAVVEGVGDHGCEYMTGGRVVILGETGVNFAAGMSGGIAYVLDEGFGFDRRCNLDMVDLELLEDPADIRELHRLIVQHMENTGSRRAQYVLDNWEVCRRSFVKVFPTDYRRVLGQMSKEDEATEREEVVHG